MTNYTEMAEFVLLWSALSELQLSDAEDEIRWRWTANGQYNAKSAYAAQLHGSYCTFNAKAIWAAKTEGRDVPIEEWWNSSMARLPDSIKRRKAAILIYTTWNLWKEHNRRVFDGKSATPQRVLALIKEEMSLRATACDAVEPPIVS
ncbi:hypothetical protein HU200_021924 [Digitaria exilis]|uniref:Uncharacterized protein n=1 Tax=Digitaria exilis TaxID=1010633 RepID=A0A835EXJ3_9POAL|nr:hypothetical protein HU200_021924 [Digitaria exilis]